MFAALAACVLSLPIHAEDLLRATESGHGIGLEMTGIDRSLEINGDNVQASGAAGGVYAYLQRDATFRAEARLLAGSLEYDTGSQEDNDTITLAEVRATLGQAIENDTRLYGGLGA